MRCIYIPLAFVVFTLNAAVIKIIIGEAGFSQPYTWMCFIALAAYTVKLYCDYRLRKDIVNSK